MRRYRYHSCGMVIGLLGLAISANAAEPVNVRQLSGEFVGTMAQISHVEVQQLESGQVLPAYLNDELITLLELDSQTDFLVERLREDPRTGQTHLRLKQRHDGVPLWARRVVITLNEDGNIQRWHGTAVREVEQDIGMQRLRATPHQAMSAAITADRNAAVQSSQLTSSDTDFIYKNQSNDLTVYLDAGNTAHLAYAVSFFRDKPEGGAPARPTYIIDATTGETLDHFDGLTHLEMGTGPGGNNKTGQYHYGSDFGHMHITEQNGRCWMLNDNVRTINLDGNTSQPHDFNCYNNDYKAINGAWSPINDAHYFGGVVYDMFMDWYNTPPLNFQLTMRVHYGTNFENAFWNGSSMTFGDGANRFYPLVDINVSAHEVAHGFTEQNSGLVYRNQSGGINEAFSDMAGEAAEYYMHGDNDWHVGSDIYKGDGAIRYMDDPPRDGNSIDSANDFVTGMNVHHSSGVFNKAFYLLATTDGWNTRQAFDIFVKANQDYWTPHSTYASGAQAAVDAAADLGYPAGDVVAAFAAVDVATEHDDGGGDDDWLENGVPVSGLSGAQASETHFRMVVPADAGTLDFTITGGSGDADLYVRHGAAPTTSSYDCRPYRWGNEESCRFDNPQAGTWHVMIRGYESYSGLTLIGQFDGADEPVACADSASEYTGTLSGSGDRAIEPDGTYYYSGSGTHQGRLFGASGSQFDLYLFRWTGSSWAQVSSGTETGEQQVVEYPGSAGYYYWRIQSRSGAGDYRFCLDRP